MRKVLTIEILFAKLNKRRNLNEGSKQEVKVAELFKRRDYQTNATNSN